jgi:hypothetical protein
LKRLPARRRSLWSRAPDAVVSGRCQ